MTPTAFQIYQSILPHIMFERVEDVKPLMLEVLGRLEQLYRDPTNQELLYGNE